MELAPATLMERLHAMTAPIPAPSRPPAPVRSIGEGLVVDVQGSVDPSYSLGIVNRRFAAALARQPGVEVWGDAARSDATHVVRNVYPPVLDDLDPTRRSFFYFAWEDSLIPPEWAVAFNRYLDGVMVPSAHVRTVLARSGVAVPVGIVPYGVEGESEPAPADGPLPLPTRKRFRFLHVSTGFPRKGCDVLLRAFNAEFSRRDDVCLIVKTLPQYDHPTARRVRLTRLLRPFGPEIVHLDTDVDEAAMRRLFRAASCLVHPARAEGFGLPVAEAMRAGIPVIVTHYSGPVDFCSDDTAILIGHRLARSRSPFVVRDAEWAEPDEASLRRAMRAVYERPEAPEIRRRVANASTNIARFTWDRAATRAIAFIRAVDALPARRVRAGMVTTWNQPCGVSEYSRQLLDAMPDDTVDWSILAPEDVVTVRPDGPCVTRCWHDRRPLDLTRVIAEAAKRDLQVVHFQTHLTMWGPGEAEALGRLRRDGRRVFMTLHSVRGARPGPDVMKALGAVDRLFVHTDEDRARLSGLGLAHGVTTLPQGFPVVRHVATRDLRRGLGLGATPVIGTFGFLREHKGLAELVEAVSILKRRYPRVLLLAVTSLYPSDESVAYHRHCAATIERLGLSDHCCLLTDFLASEACVTALQACDVVVLPYGPTIDSASAAVRVALASGVPVLTTPVPAFADVSDLVTPIARATPGAIARAVTTVLEDPARAGELVARARRRVERDAWVAVARTYAKFLKTAVADLTNFAAPYPIVIAPRD